MTKEEIKRTVPNIPGIYRIYNIDTNKSYIGQAVKLKKRLLEHLGTFPKNNLQHIAIYRAFSCHCEEKFSFEVLYKVDFEYNGKEELKSILDEKEKHYIKEYDSYKNGYNSTEGGDSSLGDGSNTGGTSGSNTSGESEKEYLFQPGSIINSSLA